MLASIVILAIQYPLTNNLILFSFSSALFLITLYFATPKIRIKKVAPEAIRLKYLFRLPMVLLLLKVALLTSATGSIPLFSEGGSNAYIAFDEGNKLASSFLLGLGGAEIALFAFFIPLTKSYKSRVLAIMALLVAVAVGLSGGKKSSILSISLAIALGEYLRIYYVTNQNVFFLRVKYLILGLGLVFFWAAWIFSKTESVDVVSLGMGLTLVILDAIMYQWAYPYMLFVSGDLKGFFEVFDANKLTYFFHSILSPLGFPAFSHSIGPSINEYLSGKMTGNGINPTFIIEGYVLMGKGLPLYAVFVGLFIGRGRAYLMRIRRFEFKVALSALILPALYTFPTDSLLSVKMIYIVCFIFIFLAFPLRAFFISRRKSHV